MTSFFLFSQKDSKMEGKFYLIKSSKLTGILFLEQHILLCVVIFHGLVDHSSQQFLDFFKYLYL